MPSRKGIPNKNTHIPINDLSGSKFGYLSVICYQKGGWKCKCVCDKELVLKTRRLTHDGVKSCGCKRIKKGKRSHRWLGVGDLSQSIVTHCKNHAITRGIKFKVDTDYLWSLFLKQKGCCALSGIKLVLGLHYNDKFRTASIDRIDSTKGYVIGNIQWVHKSVNKMKMDLDQETFLQWCNRIAQSRPTSF